MRRAKPEKREILPDIRFNSINVQTMVQHVLKSGKKSTALRLIYGAMDQKWRLSLQVLLPYSLGRNKCRN